MNDMVSLNWKYLWIVAHDQNKYTILIKVKKKLSLGYAINKMIYIF